MVCPHGTPRADGRAHSLRLGVVSGQMTPAQHPVTGGMCLCVRRVLWLVFFAQYLRESMSVSDCTHCQVFWTALAASLSAAAAGCPAQVPCPPGHPGSAHVGPWLLLVVLFATGQVRMVANASSG